MTSRIEQLPARFVIGLDLGQAHDFTALAVVQRVAELEALSEPDPEAPPSPPTPQAGEPCELHVRHLDRAPLGTPFPRIVDRVAALMNRRPLASQSDLVVDAVGVGRPVVDMLRRAGLNPLAVTAMGGTRVTGNRFGLSVPKRDLITALQVALQTGRLKIAAGLAGADALLAELQDFRVRITAAGNDQYGTWREGAHDDLVFALALATWHAERISRRRTAGVVTARVIQGVRPDGDHDWTRRAARALLSGRGLIGPGEW